MHELATISVVMIRTHTLGTPMIGLIGKYLAEKCALDSVSTH